MSGWNLYTPKKVQEIEDLIAQKGRRIRAICRKADISFVTFYNWLKDETKPEFREAVERGESRYYDTLGEIAETSLMKKVKGYTVKEVKVTYRPNPEEGGAPIEVERKNITKHIQPDTAAVIFTITNRRPDSWKNKQYNELTGKDGKDLIPEPRKMSRKEALAYLQEIKKDLED